MYYYHDTRSRVPTLSQSSSPLPYIKQFFNFLSLTFPIIYKKSQPINLLDINLIDLINLKHNPSTNRNYHIKVIS